MESAGDGAGADTVEGAAGNCAWGSPEGTASMEGNTGETERGEMGVGSAVIGAEDTSENPGSAGVVTDVVESPLARAGVRFFATTFRRGARPVAAELASSGAALTASSVGSRRKENPLFGGVAVAGSVAGAGKMNDLAVEDAGAASWVGDGGTAAGAARTTMPEKSGAGVGLTLSGGEEEGADFGTSDGVGSGASGGAYFSGGLDGEVDENSRPRNAMLEAVRRTLTNTPLQVE